MWMQIILWVVMQVISYLLTPKQQSNDPKPGEMTVATIENTQPLPVLFGTHEILQPNVVWWGDKRTTEIKSSGGGKK